MFFEALWCSLMFYDVLWCSMIFYILKAFLVSFCRSVPPEFLRSFLYYLVAGFKRRSKVWMIGDLEGKRWVSGVGVSLVPLIAARRLGLSHQPKLGEGELCTKLMVRVMSPNPLLTRWLKCWLTLKYHSIWSLCWTCWCFRLILILIIVDTIQRMQAVKEFNGPQYFQSQSITN